MLYASRREDSISIYISESRPGTFAHNLDKINSHIGTSHSENMAIVEFMFEWSEFWKREEIPEESRGRVLRLYSAPLA